MKRQQEPPYAITLQNVEGRTPELKPDNLAELEARSTFASLWWVDKLVEAKASQRERRPELPQHDLEKLSEFGRVLADEIVIDVTEHNSAILEVDWRPNEILQWCADDAGIADDAMWSRIPKTTMVIDHEGVRLIAQQAGEQDQLMWPIPSETDSTEV